MDLFDKFAPQGAPRPGERGYRELSPARADAEARARALFDLIAAIYNGGEVHLIIPALKQAGYQPEWTEGDLFSGEDEDEGSDFDLTELPDLVGEPSFSPEKVARAFMAVAEARSLGGLVFDVLIREVLADAIAPAGKLRLVLVSKAVAEAFIAQHHAAMPKINTRGLMYAVGVMRGDRLVAVATAGHPTGRWGAGRVDVRNVLELTRIASDGTVRGASSMLAARLLDLLEVSRRGDPDAPALFVTYSLLRERGTTYRALREKGLRPVALIKGKSGGGGGARAGNKLGYAEPDKIRWEAGAAALPADWSLLDRVGKKEVDGE